MCRPFRALFAIYALIAALGAGFQKESAQTLSFTPSSPDHPHASFEVSGLGAESLKQLAGNRAQWHEHLIVFTVVDPKDDARAPGDRPTLLGRHEVDAKVGIFRFVARYPSEPGLHYRVVFRPIGTTATPYVATYSVPPLAASEPSTRVVRVSPSSAVLPENLLKFYIEFSAPMSKGAAYDHLRLLDHAGKPLDLPFLELGEELWDHRGMRFTLLFDPGRIKTGLKPREELGPVLEAGKSYTLVIDRDWRDAEGNRLTADTRKTFRVGPADSTPPDPKNWRIDAPAADTRDALVVRFPEPLDRGLLGRLLGLSGPSKAAIAGTAAIGEDETSWRFVPEAPWREGDYSLRIGQALEDLAGNSIGRPFEIDVFNKIDSSRPTAETALPFRVRPAVPSATARPLRRR
jgi:hypothetical protein